jgi:hypothetical protein
LGVKRGRMNETFSKTGMDGPREDAFIGLVKSTATKSRLSSRVIETWLNDTLLEAGSMEIPGILVKPENKQPLERYGIARSQLTINALSNSDIDRIYRALFVYSLGFFEMLHKALGHAKSKNIIHTALWRVYSVLLEYCCKHNYQMLVRKVQIEHAQEISQLEKEFADAQERMFNSEKELKD